MRTLKKITFWYVNLINNYEGNIRKLRRDAALTLNVYIKPDVILPADQDIYIKKKRQKEKILKILIRKNEK